MWSAIRWLVLRLVGAAVALQARLARVPRADRAAAQDDRPAAARRARRLALPILVLLFLFGLPIFLVLLFGGLFIGMLGMVLTIGVAAIKIGLFVVLPVWLVWKLFTKVFRRGGDSRGGAER